MSDSIHTFLEASNRINSRTVSLARFQILTLLAFFKDGLQYRELKTALGISDGKLVSDLRPLLIMNYVEKFEVKIDHKLLDVYRLTAKGQNELEKMAMWMKLIQNVVKMGDENWQQTLIR